jgi:excisionase family DNA binding protein
VTQTDPLCRRPLTAADVMKAAEVADLLRVPRSTVEDWARRGIVPSKKVGRRRLYIRSKIEALLLDDGLPEAGQILATRPRDG